MLQGGRFYRLSAGRAAHYENIKPHNASDMQEGDYLIVDPACEANERGTQDKNDGNEVVDGCDLPLDLELTERVEVDDEFYLMPRKTGTARNNLKLTKHGNTPEQERKKQEEI